MKKFFLPFEKKSFATSQELVISLLLLVMQVSLTNLLCLCTQPLVFPVMTKQLKPYQKRYSKVELDKMELRHHSFDGKMYPRIPAKF
jgi:hypothetical protein